MFALLLTLLILDGILMMVVVLLQAGKGGGLAAMGGGAGTDTFMGGRQAASVLTKATWGTGAAFLALAVVLAVMSSSRTDGPAPLLQQQFQQQGTTAPQPVLPGGEVDGGQLEGPAGAVAPEGGTDPDDAGQ